MDGYMFYLAAWCSLIYLAFLASGRLRSMRGLRASILLAIIASPLHFQVGESLVYIGWISIYFYSIIHIIQANWKQKAYFSVCGIIVSMLYSSIRLFELFDPIVFIIKKEWFIAIVISLLVPILYRPFKWRLLVIMVGIIQGELLYALVLAKNSMPFDAGGYAFMDTLSLVAAVAFIWNAIEKCAAWLGSSINSMERGRKSSQ
ncbi:hypothetical protein DRW41_12400 [Neobacillus piezotolerans]|uniref:Uncharacterized protein n=1 Tax=Neobacillus piezotolerans TaxID=2259171 RepID=A0A3D8GPB6_9BACI|nr:hypothetical protein [Neobacillus piezotolerans]RDU36334.1 hypothetical protein DRW41_12400 [Neobacillus piezotolerans]